MTFATWQEASDFAWQRAAQTFIPQGIEFSKFDKRWIVRFLPKKENRYGVDLQCEAVEPPPKPEIANARAALAKAEGK